MSKIEENAGLFTEGAWIDDPGLTPVAIGELEGTDAEKELDKFRFAIEVANVIQAIKNGEMEGEYFEF